MKYPLLILSLAALSLTACETKDRNVGSMGTLGDSLSEGTLFATYHYTDDPTFNQIMPLFNEILGVALSGESDLNEILQQLDGEHMSFSTGLQTNEEAGYGVPEGEEPLLNNVSLAELLINHGRSRPPLPENLYNVAVSGQSSSQVVAQVDALKEAAGTVPDLVTVFTGTNDFCAPTVEDIPSAAEFEANMRLILTGLAENKSQIILMGIPANLHELRALMFEEEIGLLAQEEIGEPGVLLKSALRELANIPETQRLLTCGDLWAVSYQTSGFCDSLLGEQTEEDNLAIEALVGEYNDVLRNLAAEFNASHPVVGKHFTWPRVGMSEPITFGQEDLGLDCFHPSVAGNDRLALAAWETFQTMGGTPKAAVE